MSKRQPNAGDYNKLWTLQTPADTNVKGSVSTTWADVVEFWGSLWPIRGREYFTAQQVRATVTHLARTWYRDDIARPTPKMRLVINAESRTFEIESVIDVDEMHEEFEFRLIESV